MHAFPFAHRYLFTRSRTGLLHWCCLLLLCAAYLQGGLVKTWNFPGALAEMQALGIVPAKPMALLVILGELGASLLVLSGFARWAGAAWLAVFTLAANMVANRFWEVSVAARMMVENGFFEHLGLAGAFLLVALTDLEARRD